MSRYRIVPERSRIWAEARSSLHPIRVESTGLRGHLDAEVVDGRLADGAPVTGRVEIEADRLKTGNGLYDHELERRLEVRKYPTIQGQVREVRAVGDGQRYHVAGELLFHGIPRPVEGEVSLRILDDKTLEIEGERVFDVRQHGLEPPKILMLKVHPEVQVRAHVIAERES
jgi:polyisoprenoid-binding protein YceI